MNIGILGGGIGGLSSAIALKQRGFKVDVYERHAGPSEIGAGIVCWPNASFVLEQLGVLPQVAKVAGLISFMKRYSSEGEALGSMDIRKLNNLMAYPSYSILRKDLMRILTQRAYELGILIHYQHNVQSLSENITEHKQNTAVHFTNGRTIHPDVIIGADGRMNSMARLFVTGDHKPVFQKFINWIGVFESDSEIFQDKAVSDYWGVGQRFGVVPISKSKAYWAAGVVAEEIDDIKVDTFKPDLTNLFRGWPDPIFKIITQTPLASIGKIYVHDHDPINNWHKGNVLLLGDSAHAPLPTSGQGACQALEDAWHLARYLEEYSEELNLALSKFTAARMTKTQGITMAGRQLAASIFNEDKAYCQERNIRSKDTDYGLVVSGMAKNWSFGLPI
ncbi:FAD-dependent monooxygenase [Catenovulum sediminis]|uniref:FAD-dependent monooxygenase n=1 Tax=Catenovulum sediminis TaxID=1740262 RepID=A0ABV1RD25_9ALTE|nr:FAD-dependent monooxygenase [Catenovulum sediminis]